RAVPGRTGQYPAEPSRRGRAHPARAHARADRPQRAYPARMARDPQDIRSMADIITPFAIRTVATLGVPDVVRDGPVPLESIAQQCHALPDPLGRVLRFLVHHGMFTEPEPNIFGPNETSHALRSDRPGSQRAWLDLD